MDKTAKNLIINIVLLISTYIIPLCAFNRYQNDYRNIGLIQKIVFAVLLCGSILLIYINNINRREGHKLKWLWVTFEALGVIGVVYSGVVLYLILSLQNIGF
jgi:hypothetical protein